MNKINLNFGAGNPVKGRHNLDSSPFFRFPRMLNYFLYITKLSKRSINFINNNYKYFLYKNGKKLPYIDYSIDYIYCSHVMEHLYSDSIIGLIDEFHRILKKDGILRIIVPDLKSMINSLLESEIALVDLTENIGTFPVTLKNSKIISVLEALNGYPSMHKTIFNGDKIKTIFSDKFIIKDNLNYLESDIDNDTLKNIEVESRLNKALVFEFTKK